MRVNAARLMPIAVAIALNCAIAGAVARHAPQYLADWRQAHNPDAAHYVLLGKNFWQSGNFSRQAGPPFVPDILRTPVYPLLAGGIEVLTGTVLPLFIVQTALFVLCVDLTYRLGARVAGPRVGFVAALLLSADLMLAVSNWEAMSEPLYMALQTVAVVVLFRMLRHPAPSPWTAVVLGFLLGLATLTRPAGIYLPFVYAGLVCAGMRLRWPARLGVAGLLVASSCAVVVPWIARNHQLFGIARVSNADSINLAYFAATGVYQLRDGVDREQAEARLRQDFGLVGLVTANNFWLADKTPKQLDLEQRRAGIEVIRSSPLLFLEASARGILKSLLSHNVDVLASVCNLAWRGPGLDNLARGRWREGFASVGANPWWLTLAYVWECFMAATLLAAAVLGIAVASRHPQLRLPVTVLVVLVAYHCLTTAIVGLEAYARHRTPAAPLISVLAGVAFCGTRDRLAHS